ncbi:MAG: hypothetical protein KKA79_02730, partial [Nanoarchaeota archaeon]|nr:hypothetical protein [Nanoarchaeota archaeon]
SRQKTKEKSLKYGLKKGLVYTTLLSGLWVAGFGGYKGYEQYGKHKTQQNQKIVQYGDDFRRVKHYYNKGDYRKADKLSEKLQDQIDDEWFFSQADGLYDKIKDFDDKYIDPEMAKIKRSEFWANVDQKYEELKDEIAYRWDTATPGQKFVVCAIGAGLFIYLMRRRK